MFFFAFDASPRHAQVLSSLSLLYRLYLYKQRRRVLWRDVLQAGRHRVTEDHLVGREAALLGHVVQVQQGARMDRELALAPQVVLYLPQVYVQRVLQLFWPKK